MKCIANSCSTEARFPILKLCNRHYGKLRKYGDENFKLSNDTGSGKINFRFIKNLDEFCRTKSKKECWIYPAKPMKNGYTTVCAFRIGQKQKRKLVHRLSYEHKFGKIPDGMVIDHICRVRNCFNPGHLRVVTFKENVLLGESITAINSRKTLCKNGHKLSGKNLVLCKWNHKVSRKCRACNLAWQRERRKLFPDKARAYDRKRYALYGRR